jgi:hypothetical protein
MELSMQAGLIIVIVLLAINTAVLIWRGWYGVDVERIALAIYADIVSGAKTNRLSREFVRQAADLKYTQIAQLTGVDIRLRGAVIEKVVNLLEAETPHETVRNDLT